MVVQKMSSFAPVIRVSYQGKLVALTSDKGVIVYCNKECDTLFGSSSCIRGYNLTRFLGSEADALTFESLLECLRPGNVASSVAVMSRAGKILLVQVDMCSMDAHVENTQVGSSPGVQGEIENEMSLLGKFWRTNNYCVQQQSSCSDEFSFNDTFE
jgi:hypothetical protein